MSKNVERTQIIEEDEHLENLRKIIKRDFFSGNNSAETERSGPSELTLDRYIANYKSDENKVFSELMESDKNKWKEQHWWIEKQDEVLMLEQEKAQKQGELRQEYRNMIKGVAQHEEGGEKTERRMLAMANQEAKNSMFFNLDVNFGSYLGEESTRAKQINYKNCQLQDRTAEKIEEEKYQKVLEKWEDKEKEKLKLKLEYLEKKKERKINKALKRESEGNDFESEQQSEDSSSQEEEVNIMTWGQVEATPLRLSGAQYKVPNTPMREELLNNINHKIAKGKAQGAKSDKKSQMLLKIMGSSTPALRVNSSYRPMSTSKYKKESSVKRKDCEIPAVKKPSSRNIENSQNLGKKSSDDYQMKGLLK